MSITPLMPVYPRCGVRPVEGDHCHLIDEDGTRYLDRLGPRIGEEHRVGEGLVDQPLGQFFALRAAVEVGDMHQLGGLALDRADQACVRMAQQVDGNARGKVNNDTRVFDFSSA